MRRRKRKWRAEQKAHTADIELMPMMNVFMAIIPLLLMSAAFVPVTVIKTTLPGLPNAEAAAAEEPEAPLEIAVVIHPEAYAIQVNGEVVQAIGHGADRKEAREQLGAALAEIAAQHAGHREVRVMSGPTTRYEEIIEVMDVARKAGLPDAALSDGAGV